MLTLKEKILLLFRDTGGIVLVPPVTEDIIQWIINNKGFFTIDNILYTEDDVGDRTEESIVQPARSYLFDGIDDTCLSDVISCVSKSTAFTIMAKINITDTVTRQTVINNALSTNDITAINFESNTIRFGIWNGSTYFISESINISKDLNEVIVTFDGNTTGKLYLNGVEATGSNSPNASSTVKFAIGSKTDGSGVINGNIWDVRVFDRVVSSAERIAYSNNESILNTIGLYKCDETGENPTSWDSSGNENHGTKSNVTFSTFHAEDYFFGSDYQNQIGYTSRENFLLWSEDLSKSSWNLTGTANVTGTDILNLPTVNDSIRSNYSSITSGQEIFGYATLSGTGNISFLFNGPIEGSEGEQVVTLTSIPTRYNISHTQVTTDVMSMFLKRRTGQTDQIIVSDVQFNIGKLDDYQKTEDYAAIGLTPRDENDIGKDALGNVLEFNKRVKYNALIKGSNCGTFDGIDDNVDLGRPALLNFVGQTDAFEIEGWFKTGSNLQTLYSFGASGSTNQVQLFLLADGSFNVRIGSGDSPFTVIDLDDDEPHFFKVVVPAAATGVQLFIDGVEDTALSSVIGTGTSTENAYYGARTDGVSTNFNGSLWGWKHYSGNGASRVLVADHPFAEGGGTKIYDVSGNDNHGTAQNITEATFWGTKQDVFHYNLLEGHSIYEHATSTLLRVPYVINGQPLSITPPSGYTKTSDNPAGNWHNNSENYIEQQQVLELVQADIETKYWYGTNLAKGLIASDWTNLTNTTLTDDPDGSILSTTSVAGQTGFNDGTFFTADIEYVVRFRAKSNVNQGTAFTSIGDTSDLGTDPTNPNITTEYQAYEFHIIPTGTAMRIYISLANIGDSFNILDLQISAISDDTANSIYYSDIQSDVYTYNPYHQIFADISIENQHRNILTYDVEKTGEELDRIYDYLKDKILRDQDGNPILDGNGDLIITE